MSPTKSEDKAEVDWSAVSKIKASERRLQIMQSLQDKPKMAGELADEYEISRKWASINLKELEELDAVVCATPEKHNYKMYRITERGEQLMEYV
ncbi:ArsR family transcriptional regulator [Halomicrococcus sp. SG-WS-1]|uniref:ArsR family transcriptional regulator n=1 Tax=Halomicrococcus sp. SG-WS-1 TaxID=3439057 RepID=UPI003F7951E2